jgi:hypothetical protein
MYHKYETKLMSIPKICEKEDRASDEKYFLSLYLSQIPTFRDLPQVINDIILEQLKTRYYPAEGTIHDDHEFADFIGIIYLGEV